MRLKRQLFRPGRRVEQIGKLAAHPFFTRRKPTTKTSAVPAHAPRPLLARVAENVGALFSIVVSVVLIAGVVALIVAFARDIRRDTFELDAFSAPRAIVDRGYTSTAIAEAIMDEVRAVQSHAFTLRAPRQLEVTAAQPDVQVAAGGLSMKSIVRYARRLVDLRDNRISGELVQGDALALALRIRVGPRTELISVKRDDGDVAALLRAAGRAIMQTVDPYVLVVYLYGQEARSRRFAETRSAIENVLAHGEPSDRSNVYWMLGNIERAEGQPERALAAYRRYAEVEPVGGSTAVVAQLVRMGRDDEAAKLALDRANVAVSTEEWQAAGSMMSMLGRYREEIGYARRALARDPKSAEAHNSVGGALLELHRPAEALAVFQRGWKLNRDDRDLPSSVAWALIDLGRPLEALDVCNAALVAWPGDLWCREMRGIAYARLGRVEDAIAEYRYAQQNGNESPYLASEFGNLLLSLGRTQEALAQYDAALASSPHEWAANLGWARAQLALGHTEAALARFDALAKTDIDNGMLFREWARTLEAVGRADDARAKRDEAARIDERLKTPIALD